MNRKALKAFAAKLEGATTEVRLYDPETCEPVSAWVETDAAVVLDLLEGCDLEDSEIDPVSETADLAYHWGASAEIRFK